MDGKQFRMEMTIQNERRVLKDNYSGKIEREILKCNIRPLRF